MFPKEWDAFLEHLQALREACHLGAGPEKAALKWQDILQVFDLALRHEERQIQELAALAWGGWEQSIMSLQGVPGTSVADHKRNHDMGMISCHLFLNDPVLNSNKLWEGMPAIESLDCTIVQGQFDVVTPTQTAWRLRQTLKNCQLQLVRQAGHASSDPELASALVKVLDAWVF
jgi:proline iminopeptidase